MSSNFDVWYAQADMPMKGSDGAWYDAEDGFAYNPDIDYSGGRVRVRRFEVELSEKALKDRGTAKSFGGKALTGTSRQKNWAETIRAEKLKEMTAEQSRLVCSPDRVSDSSKFWIETRFLRAAEIVEILTAQPLRVPQRRGWRRGRR